MIRTLLIFLILYLFAGCSIANNNPWEPKKYPKKSKITVIKRIQNPNEGEATICGYAQNIDDQSWAIGSTVRISPAKGDAVGLDGYFSFNVQPGEVEVLAQNIGFEKVSAKFDLKKGESLILHIEFTPAAYKLYLDGG